MASRVLGEPTILGLAILAGALTVGIAADALLRVGPWGINVSLFVATLVAIVFVLGRWQRVPIHGAGRWMAIPAVAFGLAYAWRDSPVLQNLTVAAALLAL